MSTTTTIQALFVAWQAPDSRRFHVVGRLMAGVGEDGDQYEFAYVQGALKAREEGCEPFASFRRPALEAVYRSRELFPFFTNRLMSSKRPDYGEHLRRLGLKPGQQEPLTVLTRSGGVRATDAIELFAMPERVPSSEWTGGECHETYFFVHGVRYQAEPDQQRVLKLEPGDELRCQPQPHNPDDLNAVLLLTIDEHRVGFMPRYLAPAAGHLKKACGEIEVLVWQVNQPPAPFNQRVLCRMRAYCPADFQPYDSEVYQPLSPNATSLRAEWLP